MKTGGLMQPAPIVKPELPIEALGMHRNQRV
jgi:hypothetical protein